MFDEVAVVVGEFLPVVLVLGEVKFAYVPEAGHLVLVHLPDVVVLDGEDHESMGVLLQERLRKLSLRLSGLNLALGGGHLRGTRGYHLALLLGFRHVAGLRVLAQDLVYLFLLLHRNKR